MPQQKCEVRVLDIRELSQAAEELRRVGADPRSWDIMAPKAVFKVIKVTDLPLPAAIILKQEMLSLGADAAVAREVITAKIKSSDVLLLGTVSQLERLADKITAQPFGLGRLSTELRRILSQLTWPRRYDLNCRGRILHLGQRPHIMGVLNLTPDSFSDGGQYNTLDRAVHRAHEMVAQGADIIDVGGESTRPGAEPISLDEELHRVLPVVERLCAELKVPISVDTYKADVAERAVEIGAHMINDISALTFDERMPGVVAKSGTALVLMHMKGTPRNMQHSPQYDDVMAEISRFLRRQAQAAEAAGISGDRLAVDPGIGFGKRAVDNLVILNRLDEFHALGFPVLVGVSRKSFIGQVLDLPVDDRLEGTAAAVALSVARGAHILRVHDVEAMDRVVRVAQAICRAVG
jgi:dihydropteroate synthase